MSARSEPRALAVAVVGAGSLVGESLVTVLEERAFPVRELFPLGTDRMLGRTVSFGGSERPLQPLEGFDFRQVALAFFCAGVRVSRELIPRALEAGCLVIDSTSAFRQDEGVPVIVPEVNLHALRPGHRLIACPGSAAVQLVTALSPLHAEAGLTRVTVATYQAVSGAGRPAVQQLAEESIGLLSGRGAERTRHLLAFNCVPQIDHFLEGGQTAEEQRMIEETRKILQVPDLRMQVTAVRIPVFYGHSLAVNLETARSVSPADARAILTEGPGLTVLDDPPAGAYPTVATEATNRDTVYVGRIREDRSVEKGLSLWIVADNIRKGAATNSVQIAEAWVRQPI